MEKPQSGFNVNVQQVGAKKMDFEHIEEQLVSSLPEIRPAADTRRETTRGRAALGD